MQAYTTLQVPLYSVCFGGMVHKGQREGVCLLLRLFSVLCFSSSNGRKREHVTLCSYIILCSAQFYVMLLYFAFSKIVLIMFLLINIQYINNAVVCNWLLLQYWAGMPNENIWKLPLSSDWQLNIHSISAISSLPPQHPLNSLLAKGSIESKHFQQNAHLCLLYLSPQCCPLSWDDGFNAHPKHSLEGMKSSI